MKVKGIELMQMIAEGKIKNRTELVNNLGTKFIYLNKELYRVVGNEYQNILNHRVYNEVDYFLNKATFEILEDKTEEIEVDSNNYIHTELGSFKGRKMDIAFVNKLNELTKIVNKLNSSEQK